VRPALNLEKIMSLRKVSDFKVFSDPMLDRFTARWGSQRFTLIDQEGTLIESIVFTIAPDDAREMIDALQKFIAAVEG